MLAKSKVSFFKYFKKMLSDNVLDEQYVIQRAKTALENDPVSAKAWMITAKTLYPNNFSVQFEAYKVEKAAGNVKEAAKCFSELILKFQERPEFWSEINSVTLALRTENDCVDKEKMFLCDMFQHISSDIQHKLLLLTANHCDDTIEHCKLLLLFLQRFPSAVPSHGQRLIETLLTAEKHSHPSYRPVNNFRRLLVCELLPILVESDIKIPAKLLYKLLHKAIEYHLCMLGDNLEKKDKSVANKCEESWTHLFKVVDFIGRHLGWEICLTNFDANFSKDSYWHKVKTFYQSQIANIEDPNIFRQLAYCIMLFLIYCLHHYALNLLPDSSSGNNSGCGYVLVEAFCDPSLPQYTPQQTQDVNKGVKRRKSDTTSGLNGSDAPLLTIETGCPAGIVSCFVMAVNCWDLLHSSEVLNREFTKFSSHLKLELWLDGFIVDYLLYKGQYDEALRRIHTSPDTQHSPLIKSLLRANIFYAKAKYIDSFKYVTQILTSRMPPTMGVLSTNVIVGGPITQRHLHYVPLTNLAVLQYCSKLVLNSLRETALKSPQQSDTALGHILVLMQLDWGQEQERFPQIVEEICRKGTFNYPFFTKYIVHVDILEEFAYLWAGGQMTLDILPHLSGQRRIGTRGADKGAREEIRQAIRRLVKSSQPTYKLVMGFLTDQHWSICQSLM